MAISATRIKTYDLCKRRFGFQYLSGRREVAGTSADAGSKVHELLELDKFTGDETWQKYPIGKMALALRGQTPANVNSREAVVDAVIEGIEFTGRIDFTTPDTVGDYKTTSKPRGVKTVESLLDDPQRLLYTRMTGLTNSLWLYGEWDGLTVTPVRVDGDVLRDVEKFRLHVLEPAREISLLEPGMNPLQLEPNVLACGLYPPLGCPFTDDCYSKDGQLIQPSKEPDTAMPPSVFDLYMNQQPAEAQFADVPAATPANDTDKLIGTLYVDAYPVIGNLDVQPANTLIAAASQTICDDQHVKHSQLIDFGKGQYMLAAQVVDTMKRQRLFYPAMYLETRSAEGKACLFELSNLAETVVKGMI